MSGLTNHSTDHMCFRCKKWGVDINKVYNKTQRDKFRWAIEMVGPDYQF